MTDLTATRFYPKDFIETSDGLIFAVVAQGDEQGKVLCFLRYVRQNFVWKKFATAQANAFLGQYFPEYLHYSVVLDAPLHAVSINRIVKHHQPRERLQQIIMLSYQDAVEQDLSQLCRLFQQYGLDLSELGITGSLLIGAQLPGSDMDLICYSRQSFQHCRALVRQLIEQNDAQELNKTDWLQSYERRSCALSFDEYVWHEQRKFNKAMINGRKFDLNFIDLTELTPAVRYQKLGKITLKCRVTADIRAFDYPAELKIAHEYISTVVCFTATYTGQAFCGEMIEVSGALEQSESGQQRIVVGATREADGEYIKVI
jgi:predicted nucleotidyltransferase